MVALAIIFMIIGALLLMFGVVVMLNAYDDDELFGGVVSSAFGIILIALGTIIGAASTDDSNHDRDTIRICAEKGGLVNEDGLCLVDNTPVEYSDGVWQR